MNSSITSRLILSFYQSKQAIALKYTVAWPSFQHGCMLIAFQRVQGPFTFKRVQVKCQSRKELEKRIWVGSNICQKPDANEINGAAKKKLSLLITTVIIAHQSITTSEETWVVWEKGNPQTKTTRKS